MALGLAVAKFSSADRTRSLTAGAILITVGGRWIGYGTFRYRRVTAEINDDSYSAGIPGTAAVVVSLVLVLSIVAALITLTVAGP